MNFYDILYLELFLHPESQIVDLYKLAYQSAFGPEHILLHEKDALEELRREWESLPAQTNEPLLQLISPDIFLCRVNLVRYKEAGGSVDKLFEDIKSSTRSPHYSHKKFLLYIEELKKYLCDHRGKSELFSLEKFLENIDLDQPKHFSHSEKYIRLYEPHYRVILM